MTVGEAKALLVVVAVLLALSMFFHANTSREYERACRSWRAISDELPQITHGDNWVGANARVLRDLCGM